MYVYMYRRSLHARTAECGRERYGSYNTYMYMYVHVPHVVVYGKSNSTAIQVVAFIFLHVSMDVQPLRHGSYAVNSIEPLVCTCTVGYLLS